MNCTPAVAGSSGMPDGPARSRFPSPVSGSPAGRLRGNWMHLCPISVHAFSTARVGARVEGGVDVGDEAHGCRAWPDDLSREHSTWVHAVADQRVRLPALVKALQTHEPCIRLVYTKVW